ncbi:MAG: response regulator [Spirochaetota bacterium]|nr:response regulator [Spirochaetota bacterium]
MLSKPQFELAMALLNGASRAGGVDEYLKGCVEAILKEASPLSAAAYISIESEEKLILVAEAGGGFDGYIGAFPNFSLMVRRAIKKKNVIYLPASEAETRDGLEVMAVLVPLIGGDRTMGMIGMVFDIGELLRQKQNVNFYQLSGRIIGSSAFFRERIAELEGMEKLGPEEMHSEKISSLGVLASSLAHEFNNIFAVIQGYTELINMQSPESKSIQSALSVIDSQTDRGARLIESLNVFVKGRDAKFQYQPLGEIVSDVVSMQKSVIEREGIDLVLKNGRIPRVLADREQIKEAILNVLQNSIHSIDRETDGRIEISTEYVDEKVVLTVRDNGCGMTRDQVDMAIHPSMSGARPADGSGGGGATGLWLAVAYGIMKSHGGLLTISSEEDCGKEIGLVFSRTELGEDKGARYEQSGIVFFGNTRILIVDDEEPIREFLSRAFDAAGYQVIAVSSGEEAVEMCGFEDIDIVFLDYLMPGIKGDRVFEMIKKESPATDIVFITGVDEIPGLNRLLDQGLAYILKKPFKIDKILKVTNDLIYKRINQGRG